MEIIIIKWHEFICDSYYKVVKIGNSIIRKYVDTILKMILLVSVLVLKMKMFIWQFQYITITKLCAKSLE